MFDTCIRFFKLYITEAPKYVEKSEKNCQVAEICYTLVTNYIPSWKC